MSRALVIAPLAAALALPAPATAVEPQAHASVSIRTAKKWIRQRIREKFYVIPGSVAVGNCRHGYSSVGRHRVLCDAYFEGVDYRGYCGWGRVITYRTFTKTQARDFARC